MKNLVWGAFCASAALALVGASGCGSTTKEVGANRGPVAGQDCDEVGATGKAPDGCNTCTCGDDGQWSCTEMACGACQEGDTAPSPDGCNTCGCHGGQWACTAMACVDCLPGEQKLA